MQEVQEKGCSECVKLQARLKYIQQELENIIELDPNCWASDSVGLVLEEYFDFYKEI